MAVLVSPRTSLAAVLLVAAVVPAPVVGAEVPGPAATRPEAFGRLDSVVRSLSGGISHAIRAAGSLSGAVAGARQAPPATLPPAVPSSLRGPLARLLGAVRLAEELARSAASPGLRTADRRVRRMLDRPPDGERPVPPAVVRTDLLGAGTLAVALAIEETLPGLRRAAAAVPPGPRGAGCDVVEQAPALCVGGAGENSHTKDYALLVDLGGDDLHANSAGGADPLGNDLAVSVTVDLAGTDRYAVELPTPSGSRVAQGAGHVGGIGILVDAGGSDDVYEATAVKPGASAHGQGMGIAGAGVLADLGGDDAYHLANLGPPATVSVIIVNPAHYATGLGWGMEGGVGVAFDATGNDTYLLESRPTLGETPNVVDPGSNVYAQGLGAGYLGGTGLFADGGGTDRATLQAVPAAVDPAERRPSGRARAWAAGFGYASFGGVGVAVAGAGDSAWTARALVRAPQTQGTEVDAFGVASVGGFAAMHDTAGDDAYVAEADARAERRREIDDSCGCPGVQLEALVEGTPAAPARAALALASGYGGLGGVGVQRDLAGDDRYLATTSAVAVAEARDRRTSLAPPEEELGALALATSRQTWTFAQGFGTAGGAGFLEDTGGNDRYDVRSSSEANAAASAALQEAVAVAGADSESATSYGQAHGNTGAYGELRDVGGKDVYTSTNASRATTDPAGGEAAGTAAVRVQAAVENGGGALLADVDGGATDVFVSVPKDAACTVRRGDPTWTDCGIGAGVGVNQ